MIVLRIVPPFSDHLVVALSTQLRRTVEGFDEIIEREDEDFPASGLKKPSLVRLGLVATIPHSSTIGKLGTISSKRLERLQTRLADFIRP